MTEVIIFLIVFTACALAVAMTVLAMGFVMMTKNYQSKTKPDKEVVKEGS